MHLGLDMDFAIALLDNKRAPIRKVGTVSWDGFASSFTHHEQVEGAVTPETLDALKDGPAWMPADIEPGPRKRERVRAMSALVLDIEAAKARPQLQPPPFDETAQRVKAQGWQAVLHTTFQHTAKAPRYRIVLPVSSHFAPDVVKELGLHVARVLGLDAVTDTAALEPARLYYRPRCPAACAADARAVRIDGQPLDVNAMLAQITIAAARQTAPSNELAVAALGVYEPPTAEEMRADLAKLDPGMDYEGWRNVLWACASTGIDEAEDIARDWSMQCEAKYDTRAFDRTWLSFKPDGGITYGSLRHMVKQAAHPDLPPQAALERATAILKPTLQSKAHLYPMEALGPLAEAASDLASGAQVAPAMAGQSLLAAAALLTQSIANVQTLDGWPKPLSLYCLTIANSGDGKDAADRPALRVIQEHQRREGQKYQLLREAFEQDKAKRKKNEGGLLDPGPAPYRLASDLTIEGMRRSFAEGIASQGIFSTEAGAVLAGHAMTVENRLKTTASLCGLWDRGHLSVVRGGGGRIERYGVRLSAHLLIQPAALGDVLNDDALSGIGFWPRFLLAWPAPLEPRKFKPWQADSSASIRAFWTRCEQLLAKHMPESCDGLPAITLDPDAQTRMASFFESMEQEGRKGNLQDVRAFALRATELACRIAGVLTAFAGGQRIDVSTARCGIQLAQHSLAQWLEALGGKADPVPGWALTLYRWLLDRHAPVRIKDIPHLGPSSVRPANRRDQAIERLKAADLTHIDGDTIRAKGVQHA